MITEPKKREVVVTRVFDAPVEQVWKAWVEPEMVKQAHDLSKAGLEQCLDKMAESLK